MTANKEKIIEVRGLKKTYGGEKKRGYKGLTPLLDVLKGIDIDIYRGDVVCLIGPSGCGKSTFLRCLNRLEKPTGGTIKFEGALVDEAHIDKLRQKMGMVFQHFNLFPHMTVKENLEMAPVLLKLKSKEEAAQRADELLARVGAVLRRAGRGGQTLTAFGVTLDVVARQVTQNGSPVDLTPREFALLEQLMRNRGAALYRDVLYERVWGAELTDTRTLDLHIQRLRKKLGWQEQIETVYRVGYRLRREDDTPPARGK